LTAADFDDILQNEKGVFQTLGAALAYYRDRNPARQKSVNLLEPERIAAKNPELAAMALEIWAQLALALRNAAAYAGKDAFNVYYFCDIGSPTYGRCHPADVARAKGISERKVRRQIDNTRQEVIRELVARGLLPKDF
jgi:phage terminase small subunit